MSMSKSMGGLGLGLAGTKPAQSAGLAGRSRDLVKKKSDVTKSSVGGDEYSDDQFDSVSQSKSISVS